LKLQKSSRDSLFNAPSAIETLARGRRPPATRASEENSAVRLP